MATTERARPGRIVACDRLPEDRARLVRAALALDGSDLTAFALAKKLSYSRLTRMVRGDEAVSAAYAMHLDRLVQRQLAPVASRLAA